MHSHRVTDGPRGGRLENTTGQSINADADGLGLLLLGEATHARCRRQSKASNFAVRGSQSITGEESAPDVSAAVVGHEVAAGAEAAAAA